MPTTISGETHGEGASLNNPLAVNSLVVPLTVLYDFDGTNYPVYIGEALAGTATTASGWRIQKRTYTNGKLTGITWADGSGAFEKIWDSRSGYTYS